MLNRWTLVFVLLAACTATAQTQYGASTTSPIRSQAVSKSPISTGCPWLTAGTAARALGGDVSTAVSMSNTLEGICRFSTEPGPRDFLEIRVSKTVLPACPAGSADLRGIGNQASRCVPPASHSRGIEMVSSRVRDLYFTVTLASHGAKTGPKADPSSDALEQIAEQVAGSLY